MNLFNIDVGPSKFKSLFLKYLKTLILFLLIPFILINIMIYYYNYNFTNNQIEYSNLKFKNQLNITLQSLSNEFSRYTNSLISNKSVMNFIYVPTSTSNNLNSYYNTASLKELLQLLILQSEYIDSINIYSQINDNLYSVGNSEVGSFHDSNWFKKYKNENPLPSFWYEVNDSFTTGSSTKIISFFRVISDYGKPNGMIIINIDLQKLDKQINSITLNSKDDIYITDENSNILYTRDLSLVNKNLNDINELKDFISDSSKDTITMNHTKYKLSQLSANSEGLNCIAALDLSPHTQNQTSLLQLFFILFLITIAATILLSYLFARVIYKPISEIVSIIKDPSEWIDYEKNNPYNEYEDFRYIATNIIQNINSNEELKSELQKRYAKFKNLEETVLQAQIQPHFLFNTLDTIYLSAIDLTHGENDASKMIELLSDLLKIIFRTKGNIITIGEEIEHIKSYIEIQKIRYEDQFTVKWDLDKTTFKYNIVKLTLQPVIENCIYHGIKPLSRPSEIIIRSFEKDESVVFEITDTGAGMDKNTLEQLLKNISDSGSQNSNHIGLYNINQRIKLIFGDSYGITNITSEKNIGTKVTILIPKIIN